MDPVEFVSKFISGDSNSWLSRHYYVTLAGGSRWVVGTDRYLFVAVPHQVQCPCEDFPSDLAKKLICAPWSGTEIEVGSLQHWAGPPPPKMVPFEDIPVACQGVLEGVVIDQRKLAWFLKHLDSGTVLSVRNLTAYCHLSSLGFSWDGCRAVLAGLGRRPTPKDSVYTPGISAFDFMSSLPSE